MKVQFEIVVKHGARRLSTIRTNHVVDPTVEDIKQIIPTEQLLERLTGHRWHINTIGPDDLRSTQEK